MNTYGSLLKNNLTLTHNGSKRKRNNNNNLKPALPKKQKNACIHYL